MARPGVNDYIVEPVAFNDFVEAVKHIGVFRRLLIEVRNDTLIQKWPADDNWKLAENYSISRNMPGSNNRCLSGYFKNQEIYRSRFKGDTEALFNCYCPA